MLEELDEALAANIKLLSSWDKYKKEVLSGSLDWTPMHTSDVFWTENAPHFEERDFQARCGARPGHGALEPSHMSGGLLAQGYSTCRNARPKVLMSLQWNCLQSRASI